MTDILGRVLSLRSLAFDNLMTALAAHEMSGVILNVGIGAVFDVYLRNKLSPGSASAGFCRSSQDSRLSVPRVIKTDHLWMQYLAL